MLIIYVVAFIAIFYFMAIRPQQRQRKVHTELLNSLKKGDTIVTAAGIYGTVKKVDETMVEVEIAKGVRDRAQAKAAAPSRTTRSKNAPAEIESADESADEPVDETAYSEETSEGDESSRS
jgi:preprotein translocase subunit YajC